jgi:hypothetical protein
MGFHRLDNLPLNPYDGNLLFKSQPYFILKIRRLAIASKGDLSECREASFQSNTCRW